MKPIHIRDLALGIAESQLGTFYTWGGDDPSGFDCSGQFVEILKACGIFDRGKRVDYTAAGIYQFFQRKGKTLQAPSGPGCLAFWARNDDPATIYHVEMVFAVCDGQWFSIGASGGGRATKTREDAIKHNAFIKIRPLYSRKGQMFFADPFT